jgi:sporulation protein YlmC with PRC-barrel domain
MLKNYVAMAVIGSALMAVPALAQTATKSGNASSSGLWQASKLIKMNVYNQQNEKIGDIQELMLDKSGTIDSVVLGVGGFLGMGEHDVAVKFSDLKWSDLPVSSSSTSSNTSTTTTGANSSTANSGSTRTNATYPDHAILNNATKDQLKAIPQFEYNK